MIAPLPNVWQQKPGSATLPFFGVVPVLLDDKGRELEGEAEGMLCIKQAWPSCLRTVYGDHERCAGGGGRLGAGVGECGVRRGLIRDTAVEARRASCKLQVAPSSSYTKKLSALSQPQPRTTHPRRYQSNYFAPFPGYYFSGDGARRDKEGYYWITGRVDDVINVSGHRCGVLMVFCLGCLQLGGCVFG